MKDFQIFNFNCTLCSRKKNYIYLCSDPYWEEKQKDHNYIVRADIDRKIGFRGILNCEACGKRFEIEPNA